MRQVILAAALLGLTLAPGAGAQGDTNVPGRESTQRIAPPPPADESFAVVEVTPEMRRASVTRYWLYFVGVAWKGGALLLLLVIGWCSRVRDLAARRFRRPFVIAMVTFAPFTVALAVLELPMAVAQGFVVPHLFDLSDQPLAGWLADQAKGLVLQVAVGAPLAALALLGIRKAPRRWPLVVWSVGLPIMAFLVFVGPVVFDPVFNAFKPLEDKALETRLLDMASRAGIEGGRVFQVDKSRQTKTLNAYVNGLGGTKRIVLWDTLIDAMDEDEIAFVMAHEMGHYVLRHVLLGLVFAALLLLVVLHVGRRVVDWGIARFGPRWGVPSAHDPAALPWLALVLALSLFLLSPVMAGFSRRMEHEADIFALEMTRLNAAGARAFKKLAEGSKQLPNPPAFIRAWRYSHPTIAERMELCRTYRPWKEGRPNEVWKGEATPPAAP